MFLEGLVIGLPSLLTWKSPKKWRFFAVLVKNTPLREKTNNSSTFMNTSDSNQRKLIIAWTIKQYVLLKNNISISYTKNKYLVNKPKIHQRNKWNLSFCYLVLRILCGLRTAYVFSSTHFRQMFTFYTLWKHRYGNISQERVKESNFQNSWLNYRWTINYALNWDM